jgi:hypothetical protein
VLSSHVHVVWALATGGTLEDRPVYNKSRCFDTFPFPEPSDELRARIRDLGERLDAHRKRQQAQHPRLTMTEMYNTLAAVRDGQRAKRTRARHAPRRAHLHPERNPRRTRRRRVPRLRLDGFAFDAAILERLVALNRERHAEEQSGTIRWLRPAYQHPTGASQTAFATEAAATDAPLVPAAERTPFPAALAAQAAAVRRALAEAGAIVTAEQLAARFTRAPVARVAELLETLASLGQAREVEPRRFIA